MSQADRRMADACRKVAVVLEELGLEYDVVNINIQVGEQKNPQYLKLNPNGRVPALVDHSNGDFTIWYVLLPSSCSGRMFSELMGTCALQGVGRNPAVPR